MPGCPRSPHIPTRARAGLSFKEIFILLLRPAEEIRWWCGLTVGGLIGGSRKGDGCAPKPDNQIISELTASGVAVFNIDYRVSRQADPSKPCATQDPYSVGAVWPMHMQDVRAAIRWVRVNAVMLKIDPSSIVMAGESGGGQLSLIAALAPESAFSKTGDLSPQAAAQSSSVKAAIDWYGIAAPIAWYDYIKSVPSFLSKAPFNVAGVESVYGGKPGASATVDARYQSASAINYVRSGIPPILVVHGTCDMVVPFAQSRQYLASAYERAGMSLNLIPSEGTNHGMSSSCFFLPAFERYQQVIDKTADFVKALF